MPPLVSIVVPCYNEEATIRLLLDALLSQTYPRSQMEVIVADGLSQDRTRLILADFQREHDDLALRVVDNARRTIPAALNTAIAVSRGQIVLRLDAHALPAPDYVERCVHALEDGKGSNVGGVWEIRPGGEGWMAEAIACAAAHPLGAGDARYRVGAREGAVDTVPFGAFRRELIQEIGGFNERLLTNEDYEFNARIRQHGGVVWLDPRIRSIYFARASLSALARQYWRYGFWKFKMLQMHPRTLRWRQVLPPTFVASLSALAVAAGWSSVGRWLLTIELFLYLLTLLGAGIQAARRRGRPLLLPGLVLALATMHLAWGSGFLWGGLSSCFRNHG